MLRGTTERAFTVLASRDQLSQAHLGLLPTESLAHSRCPVNSWQEHMDNHTKKRKITNAKTLHKILVDLK